MGGSRSGGRRQPLGQHFLRNARTVSRILDSLEAPPGSAVVEVGPGRGALTRPLLTRGIRVLALELDPRLAARLVAEEAGKPLVVEVGDAAFMDVDPLLSRHGLPRPVPLVGNLPYESATPMIRAFVRRPQLYSRLVVMIQKEVADRILARPGGDDYGFLTLDVGAHASAERLFHVSPRDFDPPPRVRSTVLRLTPHEASPGTPEALALASLGFSARRKTLATALVSRFPREATQRSLAALRLREDARAEVLGLDDFRALASLLAVSSDGAGRPAPPGGLPGSGEGQAG